MSPDDVIKAGLDWIRNNRIISLLAVLILLGLLGGVYGFVQSLTMGGFQSDAIQAQREAPKTAYGGIERGTTAGDSGGTGDTGAGEFVEVTEGEFSIESSDADADAIALRSSVKSFDGYVQESSRHVSDLETTIEITARVPDDRFNGFTDRIRERYNVVSYNVQNYRVSTAREVDEIDIYAQTLDDLESIRQEIKQMEAGEAKIDLLMKLTREEREIQSRYQDYLRSLEQQEQRGSMATVRITVEEQRAVDLVPDDIGSKVRNEIKQMLDTVVTTLITAITDGIEVFFFAVKVIVYLVMFLTPFAAAIVGGKRLYTWWRDGRDSEEDEEKEE